MIARRLVALCCAFFMLAAPASSIAAPTLDPLITIPIDAAITAANGNMPAVMDKLATGDAVVIDDFPPYIFRGKTAMGDWWRAFEELWKKRNITGVHAVGANITQFNVKDDAAWVVVPLTITYNVGDKPTKLTGLWTFTLRKIGDEWKVSTVTWGTIAKTSP